MTAGIIALLSALAPLIVAWVLRRWAQDTPQARHDATTARIHSEVATGDSDAINVRLAHDLDRLQNARSGDSKRQTGDTTLLGETFHTGDTRLFRPRRADVGDSDRAESKS